MANGRAVHPVVLAIAATILSFAITAPPAGTLQSRRVGCSESAVADIVRRAVAVEPFSADPDQMQIVQVRCVTGYVGVAVSGMSLTGGLIIDRDSGEVLAAGIDGIEGLPTVEDEAASAGIPADVVATLFAGGGADGEQSDNPGVTALAETCVEAAELVFKVDDPLLVDRPGTMRRFKKEVDRVLRSARRASDRDSSVKPLVSPLRRLSKTQDIDAFHRAVKGTCRDEFAAMGMTPCKLVRKDDVARAFSIDTSEIERQPAGPRCHWNIGTVLRDTVIVEYVDTNEYGEADDVMGTVVSRANSEDLSAQIGHEAYGSIFALGGAVAVRIAEDVAYSVEFNGNDADLEAVATGLLGLALVAESRACASPALDGCAPSPTEGPADSSTDDSAIRVAAESDMVNGLGSLTCPYRIDEVRISTSDSRWALLTWSGTNGECQGGEIVLNEQGAQWRVVGVVIRDPNSLCLTDAPAPPPPETQAEWDVVVVQCNLG